MQTQITFPTDAYCAKAAQRTQLLLNAMKVRVQFTKDGYRQLAQIKHLPGTRFIRALTIETELSLYIVAHEAKGIHFDSECQEIAYESGITLILRKEQGAWLITDVITSDEVAYEPVFFWTQLKRGCDIILAKMLVAWRKVRRLHPAASL